MRWETKGQIIAVSVGVSVVTVSEFLDLATGGMERADSLFGWATTIGFGCTQIVFAQLDSHKLNRTVGVWRYTIFMFGPLALWPYFLVRRKYMGFLYIVASIPIYLLVMILPSMVFFLLHPELL